MAGRFVLEICAFNIQSCIIAEKAGASRVELCDSPAEGGTTPSYATISRTREKVAIPLYPIIRPRAGNYLYDEDEFAIMRKDIEKCKSLHCDGISIGVQTIDGAIDVERLKRIVGWAYPMGVTCNRVFDATPNPFKALEDVIAAGCERILTSGQRSSALLGTELLAKLVQLADDRIIIMPGAGIRSSNIGQLIRETGAVEYHASARKEVANPVTFQNPEIIDFGSVFVADESEVKAILSNA